MVLLTSRCENRIFLIVFKCAVRGRDCGDKKVT